MHQHLAPLDKEPVSVHAPYITYPDGKYRYEDPVERRTALLKPLHGVQLGAYDQHILHWLTGWEVSTAATMVSLLWRVRHAGQQDHQDGSDSR
jgi:hypothetical protein